MRCGYNFYRDIMKTALITGASGKIGSETVKKFLLDGYFVIGQYNHGENEIKTLKSSLEKDGLDQMFFPIKCDLAVKQEVDNLIETIKKSFKYIHSLVNNAGVDLYKLLTETTEEEWDYLFNVNVKSAFLLTKAFLPSMIERKAGKIVFVSSIWGQVGGSMESVYSATKGAMISFCKALAKEVGLSNINVNCVCPGVIDTPMNDRFTIEEKEQLCRDCALGRMGKPEEVASLIGFLCSDQADYITGQSITIDGGFTL